MYCTKLNCQTIRLPASQQTTMAPTPRRDSKLSQNSMSGKPSESQRSMMSPPRPWVLDDPSRRTSSSSNPASHQLAAGPVTSLKGSMKSASVSNPTSHDTSSSLGLWSHSSRQQTVSYAGSITSSRMAGRIPQAMPENDYLGYCKGAWKIQNGDRKGSMERCKEAQSWSRNAGRTTTLAQHLKCAQAKCAFRSNYISSDADYIFDKIMVFDTKGIKLRWIFLAKSHVPQKVAIRNQYAFKCLFCVYLGRGGGAGVYVGVDYYLNHIVSDHRGQALGDVLLFKTCCINDRVADDTEDFDINLWPLVGGSEQHTQQWLSDSLMNEPRNMPRQPPTSNDTFSANEPWVIDPSCYEDTDTLEDSEDARTTITAIHRPDLIRPDTRSTLREAADSNSSSCQTTVSSTFNYAPWEDNLAEIWSSNQYPSPKAEGKQPHQRQPSIPPRSTSRLPSARETKAPDHMNEQTPRVASPPQMSPPLPTSSNPNLASSERLAMQARPDQMTYESDESLGVTMCVKGLIQLFANSAQILNDLQAQPGLRNAPMLELLVSSVAEAPAELHKEWHRGFLRFGPTFEYGDYIAILALNQLTTALHSKLLENLHIVSSGRLKPDFDNLVDAADTGKHRAITCLHELKQRLASRPASLGPSDQILAAAATASPPQHILHMRPDLWRDPYFPDRDRDTKSPSSPPPPQTDPTSRRASSKLTKWTRKISLSKNAEDAEQMKSRRRDTGVSPSATVEKLQAVAELDATPLGSG